MPIRRSPNGARHTRKQAGRNHPEWVVVISRKPGCDRSVRAPKGVRPRELSRKGAPQAS